jgi:hypothetical protein
MDFQICEFLLFFGPPYYALTLKHCCVWCKWDGMVGSDGCFPFLVYYYSRWSFPFDEVALMMVVSFSCLVFLVMVNSLFWCIHLGDGHLLLLIYCTWCWSSHFSHMLYLVMVIFFFWCVGHDDGHFLLIYYPWWWLSPSDGSLLVMFMINPHYFYYLFNRNNCVFNWNMYNNFHSCFCFGSNSPLNMCGGSNVDTFIP